ncbi:hypothetical protein Tco_0963444 [Tanacetum coccineum]
MIGVTKLTAYNFALMAYTSSRSSSSSDSEAHTRLDKGYNDVPPPYTGKFMALKSDLMFIDEIVDNESLDVTTEFTTIKTVNKGVEPKTVRENSPLIIKEWTSDDESEIETILDGNPHQKEYKQKGVIDSGCSRHMTGNKCFLFEYEDCDGGLVCFGDGKGKIIGKDFKLPNVSQVMLTVPKKDNIYSVDLKDIVPTKGLTCLIAKAIIDESNL